MITPRFGGQQEDYLREANQIIREAAEKISKTRQSAGNLTVLFFELIADFSKKRGEIAKKHGSPYADEFGTRRDQYFPGCHSKLIMQGIYKTYGDKILSFFSQHLKKMEKNGKFQKKELKIEDKCDGRLTTFVIEVFTHQDLSERRYNREPTSFLPDYLPNEKLLSITEKKEGTPQENTDYREKFRQFKMKDPENYRCRKIAAAISELFTKCPSPAFFGIPPDLVRSKYSKEDADVILGNMKSLHVRGVLRTAVNGQNYLLTEYYTWMYENEDWLKHQSPSQHPIERMKLCSKVMLLQQDEFLIQDTLNEIAKIFERAVFMG